MILVIDNYDSFTYNLVQYLGELGGDVQVLRNDVASLESIAALKPASCWNDFSGRRPGLYATPTARSAWRRTTP